MPSRGYHFAPPLRNTKKGLPHRRYPFVTSIEARKKMPCRGYPFVTSRGSKEKKMPRRGYPFVTSWGSKKKNAL